MTWTSEAPMLPGFYWWRDLTSPGREYARDATVVKLVTRLGDGGLMVFWPGLSRVGNDESPAELGGEWWGPLAVPGGRMSDAELAEEARRWDSGDITPAGWESVPRGGKASEVS